MAFDLPVSGKEGFEGVFVLQGEDEDGLAEVRAKRREGGVEDFADLFKLRGDAAGLAFTGIADDSEVGRANFDPVVVVVGGRRGCGMDEKQYGQKEGKTRDLGERGAHEMFVKGSGREVKGGGQGFKVGI
jgi:hypothetical protein